MSRHSKQTSKGLWLSRFKSRSSKSSIAPQGPGEPHTGLEDGDGSSGESTGTEGTEPAAGSGGL